MLKKIFLVAQLLLSVVLLKGQDTTQTSGIGNILGGAFKGVFKKNNECDFDTHDEFHRLLYGYWKFDAEFISNGSPIKAMGYLHHSEGSHGNELVILCSKNKRKLFICTFNYLPDYGFCMQSQKETKVAECDLDRITSDEFYLTFINGSNRGRKLHYIRTSEQEFNYVYQQFPKDADTSMRWEMDKD